MFGRFRKRSYQLEHIDIGDYTPEEYERCIVELQFVNRWMGDKRALRNSLLQDIRRLGLTEFSVLDVGAGSGELLRMTEAWARETYRHANLVGLELNAQSAAAMQLESPNPIKSVQGNALQLPFANNSFDYAISSLFTHHLGDADLITVLQEMSRVAKRRIFIIDLHRHPMAYFLYTTLGKLVLHERLLREDGALSILRSFKPDEFRKLAERAGLRKVRVERSFPFRLVLIAKPSVTLASGDEYQAPSLDRMRLAS
jgi:ubiquinone/menaquinone biosynthesis C-methylase UbiE